MYCIAVVAVIALIVVLVAIATDRNPPHYTDDDQWFVNTYLPHDPDLDGDITDED